MEYTQNRNKPSLSKLPESFSSSKPQRTSKNFDELSSSVGDVMTDKDPSKISGEITLKKFGYNPVQRISIDNNNGTTTNYLKCKSPLGFYVFVLVDDSKIVSFTTNSLTAKEMSRGEILPIPQSLSNGSYHDTGNVMILCNDGMCEMKHDGLRVEPVISNFSFVSESKNRVIIPEKSTLAYPLITINEIIANPKLILTTTNTATTRLRGIAYLKCYDQISLFITRLNTLSTNTNMFSENHQKIAQSLDKYIKLKTEEQMKLTSNLPRNSIEVEKQWNNMYNLNLRHEMVVKFLTICSKFGDLSEKINEVNAEVESLNTMLQTEFIQINVDKHRPSV